jgi:2-polyprenyl-3-methyl-5-hydroxy-6-metoxy-1,4-benzoquinol methylase
MDDPEADPQLLANTYHQFRNVNRLLSGWTTVYRNLLRPLLLSEKRTWNLLDIGTGPGDIPTHLTQLAKNDNIDLHCTAIDRDPRAEAFFKQMHPHSEICYRSIEHGTLLDAEEKFDLVISNHLLHHLSPDQVSTLCQDVEGFKPRLVVFNDIHRSAIAYLLFRLFIPLLFRRSFVWEDGARSILRAYTSKELEKIIPPTWMIKRRYPFHQLVMYRQQD